MNDITLKDLEDFYKQVKFPTVQNLGNGLYRIMPEGIICGDEFLKELDREILNTIKEYNTNTSAHHLQY